ncbi:hypothetical protein [Providencia hangzhouensis]|uniref:hypothetical protein n=1 Tax=Providencia hangzhouensis TaxID=3031799 RepID=UPI0034DCD87E
MKQIQATNELLISSEAGVKQALMSPKEYSEELTQLASGLSAKYGEDTAILGNLEAGKKSPALACRISSVSIMKYYLCLIIRKKLHYYVLYFHQ